MGSRHPAFTVLTGLVSDAGCQRDSNEDYGLCVVPRDSETMSSKGVLVVVADGMGGHSSGEVASRLAVETIRRAYFEAAEAAAPALAQAFLRANEAVYLASQRDPQLKGMGTTCTALVLNDDGAICAHVGDSRLYLVRGGVIYAMTEDHSAVHDMVARGVLTPAEARRHPDKNVILRALGTHERVEVSRWEEPLPFRLEDRFLVCSDGLHDLVEDEEIKAIVMAAPPLLACQHLVALARERGGYDNITAAIAAIEAGGDEQSIAPETRALKVES
jgi:serine/threonine protein phosphatase PrpC